MNYKKSIRRVWDYMNLTNVKEAPYAPLAQLSRKVAAEGCVLLKNENNILPLDENKTVSFFGRTQIDYIKSGTGSGGLVNTVYTINIIDGVLDNKKIKVNTDLLDVYKSWLIDNPFDKGDGWALPFCQKEMIPDESIVEDARKKSDTAVIVISRSAGEAYDNVPEKGCWYLSDEEESMIELVSKHFTNTVAILNVGNIIDMKWVEKYDIKSVLYVWQGGQEGGNAIADILCGDVSPCGKLTDTIACDITDYPSTANFGGEEYNLYQEDIYVGFRYFETFAPEKVIYPFGFGLSYTDFNIHTNSVKKDGGQIFMNVTVTNIGKRCGKEVVQVYFEAPQGKLGKAKRELCAFKKTRLLLPGESENIVISVNISDMAAYDDSGITGNKSCYVLEPGNYNIYIGKCVRCAKKEFTFVVDELTVIKRLSEALAPERSFDILHPVQGENGFLPSYKKVSERTLDYKQRIAENLPETIAYTGDKGIKLIDVKNGKNTMEEFVAQLSDLELKYMITGEGMSSPKTRPGCAGAFGGITPSLSEYGIPVICVTDGPSGLRMDNGDLATSIPNGTLIACTWDTEIAEKLYEYMSIELCTHHIDSLLGPGINIHRSPLNGRNFEYLSEDPYLTGKIAAALTRGMTVYGNSATVKHFAVNSQETVRAKVISVVSERALREIYLKGFEIVIKEGNATSLMTSYNPINEHWSAVNYELNTVILREEWGYKGIVISDWWPTLSKEKGDKKNLRELVEAQNDIYMLASDATVLQDNIMEGIENGTLTRGQLQRNVINILNYIISSHTFDKFVKDGEALKASLKHEMDNLEVIFEHENPQSDVPVVAKYTKTGKSLLCIEYKADATDLMQFVIRANFDGEASASVTVNGTDGKTGKAYIDFSTSAENAMLTLSFPNIITVEKITVMG